MSPDERAIHDLVDKGIHLKGKADIRELKVQSRTADGCWREMRIW